MVTTIAGGTMIAAAAIAVAAGTMEASKAMAVGAMVTAGTVATTAVVASAGVNELAGTVSAGGADDDEVSSSLAPSTASTSTFDVRMIKHLMQTLDFILQPFRRTPLSECLMM